MSFIKPGKSSGRLGSASRFRAIAPLLTAAMMLVAGCGSGVQGLVGGNISGEVRVGNEAAAGRAVDLIALSAGFGGHTQHLLSKPVTSASDGSFKIATGYVCETGSKLLLVVDENDTPDKPETADDASQSLAALVGDCDGTSPTSAVTLDELSTVIAAYALAPVAQARLTTLSKSASSEQLDEAVRFAARTSALLAAAKEDSSAPVNQTEPIRKLRTLGNIVSSCLGTAATGQASESCRQLQAETQGTHMGLSDAASAVLAVAHNPTTNVSSIFSLTSDSAPVFWPALSQSPHDWTLTFSAPEPPVLSPAPGSYPQAQSISITSNDSDALLFYNLGSGWQRYTSPLALPADATLRALAVAGGVSPEIAGHYSLLPCSLSFSVPASLPAAQVSTAVLTLSSPAPAGGYTVRLTSNAVAVAELVTPLVYIPAGQTTVSVSVLGKGPGEAVLTAAAQGLVSASANVQIQPAISAVLAPLAASLSAGQAEQFTATVTGTANGAVRWNLSPALGTISAAGLYTAPLTLTEPRTVTLSATSSADTAKSATAVLQLVPVVSVQALPAAVTLAAGQSQQLTARVEGSVNTGVRWTMTPALGALSGAGLYTAPASPGNLRTITITATSAADSTKTATVIVQVQPSVGVTATPSTASLSVGQSRQFEAAVSGSTNTLVRWTMQSAQAGTLSSTGLYTAPSTLTAPQTITITATSLADLSKSSSATVQLVPTVAVSVTPPSLSLTANQSQQFTAAVTGSSNVGIHWTMTPSVGQLSTAGLYAAPATIASAQIITVTATSSADSTKTAVATIQLTPTISITAAPSAVQLFPGTTQQFTAAVTGTANTGIRWSAYPAVGTLSSAGAYTAPATSAAAQSVTITASSIADPSKQASATVQLIPTAKVAMSVSDPTVPVSGTVAGTLTLTYALPSDTVFHLTASQAGVVTLAAPTVTVPAGRTQATFAIQGTAPGVSTVFASASGYTTQSTTISTVPAALGNKFFGMSVNDFTHIVPRMAYGTARSWDAFPAIAWADVNTARGVFNFSSLDAYIQANSSRDVIYTFGRTPRWASSKPDQPGTYGLGQCAPPQDLSAWDDYVRAIVTHAAGRIKYWELWNEPSGSAFYCGDMPTLVQMASHAYGIIKSIDPSAVVLSPPMTDTLGPSWAGYFFALGGSRYIDVVAFHGYSSFRAEDITAIVARYRAVMAAAGISNKPLWDTESSWAGNGDLGTPSMSQQVAYMAKSQILHVSTGVERFIWYAYDGGQTWGGLQSSSDQPTAAATAYIQTRAWLLGASLTACTSTLDGTWTCNLTRPGGYSAQILWNDGVDVPVKSPAALTQFRDLAGGKHAIVNHNVSIGNEPILLESGDPAAVQ